MPAITRYILSQLVTVTFFVTLGLTFAIWLTQSLRFLDYIVNRGLPATTFFGFIGLLLPSFIGIVLPIATFCAVLVVYNKLVMDSEMVVLRAAGLSHLQLARPAIIAAAGVTLAVYAIVLYIQPPSYRAFKDLQHQIRHDYSTVLLQEGRFNSLAEGITVYVRERSADGELRGILVHDKRDPERPVTMMAERGALVGTEAGPRVIMVNGNRQEIEQDSGNLSLLHFDRYTVEITQLGDTPQTRWRGAKERYLSELLSPGSGSEDLRARSELLAEGHQRIVAPLYTLAFVLIGLAALLSGEFNRRGQAHRLLFAILCVAVLESLALALHDLAGRWSETIPLMYLAALLPGAAGLFVLLRSPRKRPAAQALLQAGAE
ncbi:MAG: LPS export ABC transporter permease LptF [Rhodospirillales bacterium]|nr:LPS export ABC transporter permease LptF [Rhodospirillales bacterium]